MIKLFYWPTPNGWKTSIMLEECGLPYTVELVNIGRGQQFEPDFLEISPNGKMPALIDDDPPGGGPPVAIFESGAILLYLAEKAGRLLPTDVRGRFAVAQWLMWQMAGLGPMAGQNGHFLLYAPEKIDYAIERYGREVRRLYSVLDHQLQRTESYIAGEYSIADIACFPWVVTHKAQGLTLDDYPNIKRWFATLRARDEVQRGLAVGKELMRRKPDEKAREALFGANAPNNGEKPTVKANSHDRRMTMPKNMLTGYKVLDITQFVAGPVCTRILADAGADVIKVELAPHGDRTRTQGFKPRREDVRKSSRTTYFFQHNHSKRSLAIDLKNAEGRRILKELASKCDVVVENFAPGVMARAGLSYDDLRKVNPNLVMCSISFAGQQGPLSNKPGYDYIAQAYSGITSLIGEPDRSPSQIPIAIGDVSTGISAAMAIGFGLLHRERTGKGQYIEATLLDTYFHMHEANVPKVAIRGDAFVPKRAGSQHPDGGPVGIFDCGNDQFVAINILAHQWPQFARTLGRPELIDDPRFATSLARRDNNDQIVEIVEAWLHTFRDREAAIAVLEADRIPCAPILTLNEAMRHPHLLERGTVRTVCDDQIGEFAVPGMPVRFSEWPVDENLRADMLGESNEAILDELGMSPEEIAALYESGVIVHDPLLDEAGMRGGER